ncbi:MAG TPA: hypothetical protein VH540_02520 [Ktedonobacterales bacterium]|jgi:hypothetical protein
MFHSFLAPLANIFLLHLDIGGEGSHSLMLTIQIGDLRPLQLDLIQVLIVLGLCVLASVLVNALTGWGTGSLIGAFFWALLGIWVFLVLIPLVWTGDILVAGLPLFTSLVGAFVGLLVRQLLHGGYRRRRVVPAA